MLGSVRRIHKVTIPTGVHPVRQQKAKVSRFHTSLANEIYQENKSNSTLYRKIPQELLDQIFSNLSLSSAISAKSWCKLFYQCGPPLCRLASKARKQPVVVYDLRCKSEKRGELDDGLCCSCCRSIHPSALFNERHQAKAPDRRHCKGSIYYVELNPHWSLNFRQFVNLVADLHPYTPAATHQTPYQIAPTRTNPVYTIRSRAGLGRLLRAAPDDQRVANDIELGRGRRLLSLFPQGASTHNPNKDFCLPGVQIYTSPGRPAYKFNPLHVSSAWLREADNSIVYVAKWTLQVDIDERKQLDKSAILAEVRHYNFDLGPHLKFNSVETVNAVWQYHSVFYRYVPLKCNQCGTVVRVSSSKEKIPELPTHISHRVVFIVERNLGDFKSPAQLQLETENGRQKSMPPCLQDCCRTKA